MREQFGNEKDLGDTAWSLFTSTGGLGYYLLYKELKGEHDK
jgi:hypothetical protein